MDNTDMYWDDICWNDVVPDWDENGEMPDDEDENWNRHFSQRIYKRGEVIWKLKKNAFITIMQETHII